MRRRDGTDVHGEAATDLREGGGVLLLVGWAAARHVPHASPRMLCRSRGMISIRTMPSNDTMRQSIDIAVGCSKDASFCRAGASSLLFAGSLHFPWFLLGESGERGADKIFGEHFEAAQVKSPRDEPRSEMERRASLTRSRLL